MAKIPRKKEGNFTMVFLARVCQPHQIYGTDHFYSYSNCGLTTRGMHKLKLLHIIMVIVT